jgi:prolipoprotein diacylglyceryl transferase
MTDGFLHWHVDPVLLRLGPLELHWYGLLFASGFLIGIRIMAWIYRSEGRPPQEVDQLLLYVLIGTVVGARLGHCLFYDPGYYLRHPLEILQVWKGGLASHGGALGVFLALFLYTRVHRDISYLWLLDRIAIPASLAGALIRFGNFFNSEIIGKPWNGPWAIVFDRVDSLPRHPVQLYEALAYTLIFAMLVVVYRRSSHRPPAGRLFGLYLVAIFSARILLEFYKLPQAAYEAQFTFSVGQWLSVPFVVLGLVFLVRARVSGG